MSAENETLRQKLADTTAELDRARANITALLRKVGGTPTRCRGCSAEITFLWHYASQRLTPYNPDGVNHFLTCPYAKRFKEKKQHATETS